MEYGHVKIVFQTWNIFEHTICNLLEDDTIIIVYIYNIYRYYITHIRLHCETSILSPSLRKHSWTMQDFATQRTLGGRAGAYTMGANVESLIWKLGL